MLYYYLDGLNKKGPYTSEELKTRNLKPETLVFSDGMDSWKPIKEIESLNSILFEKFNDTETNTEEISTSEVAKEAEVKKEQDKIKIPSILFLFIFYGISIGIAYFIASSQKQNDLNEINKKIDEIFKDKSAVTDYTFDGSNGQLLDVYLSSFFEGIGDDKNVVKTKKRILAYKPTSNNSDKDDNSTYNENQLKQWNLFKDFVQYYECDPFSGFNVLRIEKNLTTFSIIKSWSGDMAYKVAESKHYPGYSSEYYSSIGYDIPTHRPSVSNCYEGAAKFLTSEKEDKSYEAGSFNKISSFTDIETKFYEISQRYPKYTRLLNKIHVDMGNKSEGDVIDNSKITDVTSANDASVFNSQWIVWYKSLTNSYYVEEKKGVCNKYWLIYSSIGIAMMTIVFLGLKYRKRISLK
jgi:hypothetical protein